MKEILKEGAMKAVLVVLWALVVVVAIDIAISILTFPFPNPVVK